MDYFLGSAMPFSSLFAGAAAAAAAAAAATGTAAALFGVGRVCSCSLWLVVVTGPLVICCLHPSFVMAVILPFTAAWSGCRHTGLRCLNGSLSLRSTFLKHLVIARLSLGLSLNSVQQNEDRTGDSLKTSLILWTPLSRHTRKRD